MTSDPAQPEFEWPDDVVATAGLYSASIRLGDEPSDSWQREATVTFGRPLVHRLSRVGGSVEFLVCFPYDLTPLVGRRAYGELEMTVDFGDTRATALDMRPAPGSTQPDGTRVSAFGRGHHRVTWVFRPPPGGLRPDGHWNQVLLWLPADSTGLDCRVACRVPVHRTVLGRTLGTTARTLKDAEFRIELADAWQGAPPAAALPWPMAVPDQPAPGHRQDETEVGADRTPWERRLFLAVDVERYGRRNSVHMGWLQRDLWRAVRAACAYASVDWHACGRQASGDGYLLVLPLRICEPEVVSGLVRGLTLALDAANTDARRPADIGDTRLRASLHQGQVREGPTGYVGRAVVALFRVLDSEPLRAALGGSKDADLAVAWSDSLYGDLVHDALHPGLDQAAFHEIRVCMPEKGFTAKAWIELRPRPGHIPFTGSAENP